MAESTPDPRLIDGLAAIIRRVDGNHSLGAAALAERLLDAGVRVISPLPESAEVPNPDAATYEAIIEAIQLDDENSWPGMRMSDVSEAKTRAIEVVRGVQDSRQQVEVSARSLPATHTAEEAMTLSGPEHNHVPQPFGRRVADCPRCDALAAGTAQPRQGWDGRYRQQRSYAEQSIEIRAHFASEQHRSGACGPVCTYGDW